MKDAVEHLERCKKIHDSGDVSKFFGKYLKDKDGKPKLNRNGEPIFEKSKKFLYTSIVLGILVLFASGLYYCYGHNSDTGQFNSFATFFGWPKEKRIHNVMVGLLLGFVFGFLDNFGLFQGMENLDPIFYTFASKTMLNHTPKTKEEASGEQLHSLADGMMNGLGNTFSDLLGILVGTAVLLTANASFGVDAGTFWPMDFVAIILGCLVGAYLPAIQKDGTESGANSATIGLYTMVGLLCITMYFPVILGPKIFFKMPEESAKDLIRYIKWILFVIFIIIVSLKIVQDRTRGRNDVLMEKLRNGFDDMIDDRTLSKITRLQHDLADLVDGEKVGVRADALKTGPAVKMSGEL